MALLLTSPALPALFSSEVYRDRAALNIGTLCLFQHLLGDLLGLELNVGDSVTKVEEVSQPFTQNKFYLLKHEQSQLNLTLCLNRWCPSAL